MLRLLDEVRTALSQPQPHGGAGKPKPLEAEPDVDPALARVREQVVPLWEEWLTLYEQPNPSDKAHATFLNQLLTAGWLRFNNEGSDRFLRVLVESAVSASVGGPRPPTHLPASTRTLEPSPHPKPQTPNPKPQPLPHILTSHPHL